MFKYKKRLIGRQSSKSTCVLQGPQIVLLLVRNLLSIYSPLCSWGLGEVRVHDFERVEWLVTVGHHAESVGHPESREVDGTVATHPSPVAWQVVTCDYLSLQDWLTDRLCGSSLPGSVWQAGLLRVRWRTSNLRCHWSQMKSSLDLLRSEAQAGKNQPPRPQSMPFTVSYLY